MLAAHSEMLLGSKDDRRRGSGSSKKEERYGHQWGGQYDEYGYGGWDYGYGDMNNGMARRPDTGLASLATCPLERLFRTGYHPDRENR